MLAFICRQFNSSLVQAWFLDNYVGVLKWMLLVQYMYLVRVSYSRHKPQEASCVLFMSRNFTRYGKQKLINKQSSKQIGTMFVYFVLYFCTQYITQGWSWIESLTVEPALSGPPQSGQLSKSQKLCPLITIILTSWNGHLY